MRFLFATTMLTTLTGCPVAMEHDKAQDYPLESVTCDHPDSQFEAVVNVSVDDNQQWDEVRFYLTQGERQWETSLWEPDEQTSSWDTRMQLYELDCEEDYTYEFFYIENL